MNVAWEAETKAELSKINRRVKIVKLFHRELNAEILCAIYERWTAAFVNSLFTMATACLLYTSDAADE